MNSTQLNWKPDEIVVDVVSQESAWDHLVESLAPFNNLSVVHLVVPKSTESIQIGDDIITVENLLAYVIDFNPVTECLNADGTIYFHGLEPTGKQSGHLLLDGLASLLGVKVKSGIQTKRLPPCTPSKTSNSTESPPSSFLRMDPPSTTQPSFTPKSTAKRSSSIIKLEADDSTEIYSLADPKAQTRSTQAKRGDVLKHTLRLHADLMKRETASDSAIVRSYLPDNEMFLGIDAIEFWRPVLINCKRDDLDALPLSIMSGDSSDVVTLAAALDVDVAIHESPNGARVTIRLPHHEAGSAFGLNELENLRIIFYTRVTSGTITTNPLITTPAQKSTSDQPSGSHHSPDESTPEKSTRIDSSHSGEVPKNRPIATPVSSVIDLGTSLYLPTLSEAPPII